MSSNPGVPGSGLGGISRLAFDAVTGLVGLVETMDGNIAHGRGRFASRSEEKMRGMARLVYLSIRGVTRLAGTSADAALALLDQRHPGNAEGIIRDRCRFQRLSRSRIIRKRISGMTARNYSTGSLAI